MTIHDPVLLPLKDAICANGGALTLDDVQQKFVDIIEGRKANAMAVSKSCHRNINSTQQKCWKER
jgi:hypothetical protein